MLLVLDAPVAASWAFPDEQSPIPQSLLDRRLHVPALWWYEVRNILISNERRGRISAAGTSEFLSTLAVIPIILDRDADSDTLMRLARTHHLTVYDAAYLELAARLQAPLATLDRQLAAAAAAARVEVLGAALKPLA